MALVWDQKTQSFVDDSQTSLFNNSALNTSVNNAIPGATEGYLPQINTGLAGGASYGSPTQQAGMFGLNQQDMSNISGLGGLAATGYDIYDRLLGGSAKAQKAQMRNANAQAAYNEDAAQHKKDFYAGVAKSGLSG